MMIEGLAEFRYRLRQFLHFSEEAARRSGLTAQQHQMLLQVAGAPAGTFVTVGWLAERLCLRHHSVVELTQRSEEAGLLVRTPAADDRRQVVMAVTALGMERLTSLTADHTAELREHGPALVRALEAVLERAAKEEQ